MPVSPLFCVINGRTRRRAWPASAARASVRRLFVPHQLRHAHAMEIARELGIHRNVAGKWRARFLEHRLDGLTDESRPGAHGRSPTSRSRP
jgi:hypothetical protein